MKYKKHLALELTEGVTENIIALSNGINIKLKSRHLCRERVIISINDLDVGLTAKELNILIEELNVWKTYWKNVKEKKRLLKSLMNSDFRK